MLAIDKSVPGAKNYALMTCRNALMQGIHGKKDFLPVLDYVKENPDMCKEAINSFQAVTSNLDERITQIFSRTVQVNVILYIGLCNGAGWVTEINGTTAVLLGLEKILELR